MNLSMEIELHYTQRGDGSPLLLLHGNGEDSTYFEHQVHEFSHAFTVFAVDTRGHGGSPMGTAPFTLSQFADDLLTFMDIHDIHQADLLGFSDGGNIALLFALRYPERVHRLILNSANLYPEGLMDWLLQSFIHEHEEACQTDTPEARYQAMLLELMINEPHIDPADLAALQMPVLVIAGENDIVEPEHTCLIAESLPNGQLVVIPGGHDCANQNPTDFNRAVWKFLAETSDFQGGAS